MKSNILKTMFALIALFPAVASSQFVYDQNSIYKSVGDKVKVIASRSEIGYLPVEKPITWQYREDNGTWQNFQGPDSDTLIFDMKNDIAVRYTVQWCNKVYTSPETSFTTTDFIEGENLITDVGVSGYIWKSGIKVSDRTIEPRLGLSDPNASNNKQLTVPFFTPYSGPFSIEFKANYYKSGNYRLAWQASNRPSGKVAWYINGVKVGEYDNDKWGSVSTPLVPLTGELAGPKNGTDKYGYTYNSAGYRLSKNKTMNYVEFPFNLPKDTTITIKAVWNKGQGSSSSMGLNIDQLRIVPITK
jgi:hypothetical protein